MFHGGLAAQRFLQTVSLFCEVTIPWTLGPKDDLGIEPGTYKTCDHLSLVVASVLSSPLLFSLLIRPGT